MQSHMRKRDAGTIRVRKGSIVCALLVFIMCGQSIGADPSDFRYKAQLTGVQYGHPVRAALASEVLRFYSGDREDIAIFDETGTELECEIFMQQPPEERYAVWEVLEDTAENQVRSIVLRRDADGRYVSNLVFSTRTRGFFREIEVYAGREMTSWRPVGEGVIADLRPEMDVVYSTIEFNETNNAFLKVRIKDVNLAKEQGLQYDLLNTDIIGLLSENKAPIPFDPFTSRTGKKGPKLDRIVYKKPSALSDNQGGTIIDLGKVGLPVEYVGIVARDHYYYCGVEILTADGYGPAVYRVVGRGVFYRIAGGMLTRDILAPGLGKTAYARLKLSGSGSPYMISEVHVSWARRYISFIPEHGRHYWLYWGGEGLSETAGSPGKIRRETRETLTKYAQWNTGPVQANKAYDPVKAGKGFFAEIMYIGIIGILIYTMGFWLFQLRSGFARIPRH